MFPRKYLVIVWMLVTVNATAQNTWLTGYLQDSITLFPISFAAVVNSASNKNVVTDDAGFFRLEAARNDVIYISAKSYNRDTLRLSYLHADTVHIVLTPAGNLLPNVIVRANLTKYQLDSIERKRDFEDALGNQMPAFSSSHPSGFGLTLNLDKLFKKKYKGLKDKKQLFERTEKTAYVDYRFSPHLVASFTGFKGDVLRDFINRNKPAYEWLRSHLGNEDVMYYINDKLKVYKKTTEK